MRLLMMVMIGVGTAILMSACSPSSEGETEGAAVYRSLSIEAFGDIMDEPNRDYTVINVHIPYDGEIEGTQANIAFDDIAALTAALPDKNAPIILYCRSGNMSEEATRALVQLGYTQVYDVPGGMKAWQASGRTLINHQ
ncbi:rhodanese-like domain-containing protein [Anaerolineales bacterium]